MKLHEFFKDGLYGLMDSSGKIILNAQFRELVGFEDLYYFAMETGCGFIYESGIVSQVQVCRLLPFRDNLAPFEFANLWGFIDKNPQIVIEPYFDEVTGFCHEISAARIENQWGFIDGEGKWILKPRYDSISFIKANIFLDKIWSENGLAAVRSNDKCYYVNKNGENVFHTFFDDALPFKFGAAPVLKKGKYGFINENGSWIIEPQFDEIGEVGSCGITAVRIGDKFGYINSKCQVIAPIEYECGYEYGEPRSLIECSEVFTGAAAAIHQENEKSELVINAIGNIVHMQEGCHAGRFEDGIACACLSGKYGVIDSFGTFIVPPVYDKMDNFNDGIAFAEKSGRQGFIDRYDNFNFKMLSDASPAFYFLEDGVTRAYEINWTV